MSTQCVTQQQVIEELQNLEQEWWFEVLDIIGFLKERASREHEQPSVRGLTARALLQSEVVGMWADRDNIGDSVEFARRLRSSLLPVIQPRPPSQRPGIHDPRNGSLGQAQRVTDQRQKVLQVAYAAHPERFVRGEPKPPSLPQEVWINRPQSS